MKITNKNWALISIFNLLIVVVLGTLMRYKIAFEFPFFQQKNLLHAHSHFAFSGWISQTLFFLLAALHKQEKYKKYNILLLVNLICSYGMLGSFIIQGYGLISIIASTLSIIITYFFTYFFLKDNKKNTLSNMWIKGGLFFNFISTLGTFFLAYMLATKNINENMYHFSIYFYLHFQYNGWFLFTIIGLFIKKLSLEAQLIKKLTNYFYLFFISCIITYIFSILWVEVPKWVFLLTAIFTFLQLFFWFKMQYLFITKFKNQYETLPLILKRILLIILIATTLKFVLPIGLLINELKHFVYSNRTIVIAYLHLVFLCIITLYLLANIFIEQILCLKKMSILGIGLFSLGIIFNQLFLFSQGGLPYFDIYLPLANKMLVYISLFMLTGILLLLISQIKNKRSFKKSKPKNID
ncbi:hypothetical protein HUE46_12790 [Flavobacterium columnare]|uniref:Uncharacterized protein n=2 Tax=Flavobacterium columnare TaxID=996 RepID=G8XB02_FLACA|nr:hypothetical protein [Flavobacterium columnare]AEW85274.1 hypothetical protein FCOL_02135 [Flavobacterium columnare ATCC 49512]AMO19633.1 hypothetical protein UN65_04095 [Flavobacterium columnare]AUX17567.1 hypothetical protein AQ623_04200 [Flavobacterium columnare]MBF6652596.1 hypothetical protein [Flavobacterium columnare]MBF6655316.1 hypothetical protein [Flavobacterium columnare]